MAAEDQFSLPTAALATVRIQISFVSMHVNPNMQGCEDGDVGARVVGREDSHRIHVLIADVMILWSARLAGDDLEPLIGSTRSKMDELMQIYRRTFPLHHEHPLARQVNGEPAQVEEEDDTNEEDEEDDAAQVALDAAQDALTLALAALNKSPMQALNEFAQNGTLDFSIHHVASGSLHARLWTAVITVDGGASYTSPDPCKKSEARQAAARLVLLALTLIV